MRCVLFLNSRRLICVVDKALIKESRDRFIMFFSRSFYVLTRVSAGVWFILHFGDLPNYAMLGT